MKFTSINPKQALNKAFLKKRPLRDDIDKFKHNFIRLLDKVDEIEKEENQKIHIRDFLRDTYYIESNEINIKGNIDLAIHLGKTNKENVGVIFEAKRPSNRNEMFTVDKPYTKAICELILYYFEERNKHNNFELKNLIITNIYEWYIFDANVFDKVIYRNTRIKNLYEIYSREGKDTTFFYEEVSKNLPFIDYEIICTHFDIRKYKNAVTSNDKTEDKDLIALYKILSPYHLLKLPFADDSNSLDTGFYKELLHIIGLEETKDSGKIVIQRKKTNKNSGSLIENTINILETDGLGNIQNLSSYGETKDEQLFNIALELVITWINRILFLKLLESQLISYHYGDKDYRFLNKDKIVDFDELYKLFHQVLAKQLNDRTENIKSKYSKIPYLNSSLFEISDIEKQGIKINSLDDGEKLEFISNTILKEDKKYSKSLPTIEYLFKFLDAYDFAGESSEEIQEESKLLINSSVLGKVFEKINGYKDGSYFTPGFITMYMCRESIRLAVVQKFKEKYGWSIDKFEDIGNYLTDHRKSKDIIEFNEVINTLRICDPAVGSGHFLVSALNEIIAVKSELRILADNTGKCLPYSVVIENDELIITNYEGDLFEYKIRKGKPLNIEIQNLQKTLFQEKQNIIENCLFGVDINPKSVIICRLRLWIELLKNAYYKEETGYNELETLPNIDTNIKCGNSLVSRFSLDSDLKKALKSIKYDIKAYQGFVQDYKNEKNRELKQGLQKIINDIKNHFSQEINQLDKRLVDFNNAKGELERLQGQYKILMSDSEKKKYEKEVDTAAKNKLKYETIFENFKYNPVYDNAFEWRFEFPEVLDDAGNFIGFDVVIGNPPYFSLSKSPELNILQNKYHTYDKSSDIYTLFYELGFNIIRQNGLLIFITSRQWLSAGYGKALREFISEETNPIQLIDFGELKIFDEATVFVNILLFDKSIPNHQVYASLIEKNLKFSETSIVDYLNINNVKVENLNSNIWKIGNSQIKQINQRIENKGKILSEWKTIEFFRGVTTGLNEAFIINKNIKSELEINVCNNEIIKPILRGKDIKRYKFEFSSYYIIETFQNKKIDLKDFPLIANYLQKFRIQLEPKPKNHVGNWNGRKPGRYKWFEIQDDTAYWSKFLLPKIVWIEISDKANYAYDETGMYLTNSAYFMVGEDLKYLLAVLNSKLADFYFFQITAKIAGGRKRYTKQYVEQIPIPQISKEAQQPFIDLVDTILAKKEKNEDTTAEEKQIDRLVYALYELTDDEIKVVEGE